MHIIWTKREQKALKLYAHIIRFLWYHGNDVLDGHWPTQSPSYSYTIAEYEASVDIKTNEHLAGDFPRKKLNLVQTWIELHRDELMANWEAASNGEEINKIEPLR